MFGDIDIDVYPDSYTNVYLAAAVAGALASVDTFTNLSRNLPRSSGYRAYMLSCIADAAKIAADGLAELQARANGHTHRSADDPDNPVDVLTTFGLTL